MQASHLANASDEPLTLVLYPNTMDMLRLHCLVVGSQGKCHEIHVSGRDMRVVALQFKLSSQLYGMCANDLELFLARPPETSGDGLLLSDSVEASDLACMEANRPSLVGSIFITDRNAMLPMSLLHSYFPVQPSLYEGRFVVIHVLVWIPKMMLSLPSPPRSPLAMICKKKKKNKDKKKKKKKKAPSKFAVLLETWKEARIEVIGRPVQNESGLPQLLRLGSDDPLWLGTTEEALTEIYVPASWRRLRGAICSWLESPVDDRDAPVELWGMGRRALLTGAPGIGKSVFLVYLLIHIVRSKNSPVCIVDIPGVTFTLINRQKGVVTDGQRGVDFAAELSDPSTVYFFDVSPDMQDARLLPHSHVEARTIATSPQRFVPTSSRHTKTFVLPQWTVDDVRNCVKLWMPRNGASSYVSLYYKWGGIPGHFLRVLPSTSTEALELALSKLKPVKVTKALMAQGGANGWEDITSGTDADLWKHLVVLASEPASEGFEHDGQVAFTSQYVCDRVMELLTLRTSSIRQYRHPKHSRLWIQINTSLTYLAQEEEEKSSESPKRLELFPKPKSRRVYANWS